MTETEQRPPRPQPRRIVAHLVIGVATLQTLGLALRMPSHLGANDISRWCTVWSLLERGTYAIDDCPWHTKTPDKVYRPEPFPSRRDGRPPVKHFYSSKPAFLPTLIAGMLAPLRATLGAPLDSVVLQPRQPQQTARSVGGTKTVAVETPQPERWPAFVFYFKAVIILLNVVPYGVFLALFARLLDRFARGDWAWYVSLFAAAWGTQLLLFSATLNNHTVAAFSAFFATYGAIRIGFDGSRSPAAFAATGFFAAFCACCELPAVAFLGLVGLLLLIRAPRPTLAFFVPAAAVPLGFFALAQYLEFGTVVPVYSEFGKGTEAYGYTGSYWNAPMELDALHETKIVYLFHMLLGHHGIFSLTPIFIISAWSVGRHLSGAGRPLAVGAWMTALLSVVLVGFYAYKTNNYGGTTQGLRWLFWLFPLWLVFLPLGLNRIGPPWLRGLVLVALFASAFSVGYALRNPWSHPWLLDCLEHLNVYPLVR